MNQDRSFFTRRQFTLCLGGMSFALPLAAAASDSSGPWTGPASVKKVYIGEDPKATWPYPKLDYKQEMAGIDAKLAEIERKHPEDIRFTGTEILRAGDNPESWAQRLSGADALLVLDLTASTGQMTKALGEMDVPKLLFTRPITGWAYMTFAAWIQQGKKADMIASSDFNDLEPHLPLLRTIHHVRNSKVLIVRPESSYGREAAQGYATHFGTAMSFPTYEELKALYNEVDVGQAEKEADEFSRGALRVSGPPRNDIRDALRLYLAVNKLLEREKANAITIDCLGGFRRGNLPAYPCAAWTKLNDRGMYGVCEADLPSTMTQILITPFTGKPGFVSDPTFDTSRNEVIHAHCVAATRMLGLDGKPLPYVLRTHMEDEKGVSIQVMMPEREKVTVAKLASPQKLLVSTGETTTNVDDRRGCRTKIITQVSDARKMVEGYSGGLHRVLFYGDHVEPVRRLGRLMGFQVVNEI